MSFILEALKKSDKKRQAEAVPKLQTEHGQPLMAARRRPMWLPILLLVLLLAAAGFGWFLGAGQESPVVTAEPAGVDITTPPSANPVTAQHPAPQQATVNFSEPTLPTELAAGFAKDRIYAIEALPGSIRARLPALHMALHAYSQARPAASLVRINNQILREGAELSGGLVLQKVTAEGVVLSYRGYRFLLPRKTSLDN